MVYLADYREKAARKAQFEVEAHLYIELCSDGETRFGVVGAHEDNAICMLEPMFVLGRQLVQLATS